MSGMKASVTAGVDMCRQSLPSSMVAIGTVRRYGDNCDEKEGKKKTMIVCQAPDDGKKPIPPYEYGYCREPDPEPPTGCPKGANGKEEKKDKKGPCCKGGAKGGCQG